MVREPEAAVSSEKSEIEVSSDTCQKKMKAYMHISMEGGCMEPRLRQ